MGPICLLVQAEQISDESPPPVPLRLAWANNLSCGGIMGPKQNDMGNASVPLGAN